jgi:hypothetical protein
MNFAEEQKKMMGEKRAAVTRKHQFRAHGSNQSLSLLPLSRCYSYYYTPTAPLGSSSSRLIIIFLSSSRSTTVELVSLREKVKRVESLSLPPFFMTEFYWETRTGMWMGWFLSIPSPSYPPSSFIQKKRERKSPAGVWYAMSYPVSYFPQSLLLLISSPSPHNWWALTNIHHSQLSLIIISNFKRWGRGSGSPLAYMVEQITHERMEGCGWEALWIIRPHIIDPFIPGPWGWGERYGSGGSAI